MQNLPRVKAAYENIDDLVQKEIASAVSSADASREAKLIEAKQILDYAFFVLCFAQFERRVNEESEQARDRRASNPDWTRRRAWDLDAYASPERVPFKDRVAMVMDRSEADYGRVLNDYAKRNHVAHGGLTEPIAALDQFIGELFVLATRLKA